MKQNAIQKYIVLSIILALFLSGCGATISIKSNTPATITPTTKPAATAIIVPTATPKPTIEPTPALPKMVVYTHPSNSFSISVPADWTKSENSGYVFLSSPDQSASVELAAENTNTPLSAEAFTKAINAFEFNVFARNKNYKEASRDVQVDKGVGYIGKTLDLNKIPYRVMTVYTQVDNALYIQSYYATESTAETSAPLLKAMIESFKTNIAYIADLPPFTSYPIIYSDPNNFFSLWVPSIWTYEDTQKDGSVIAYSAPDNTAAIMLIKLNMGETVTRTAADTNSLVFLRTLYKDVRIAKTAVLKNGSIQMTWGSKSGKMQGECIYKWNGTYQYFLIWMTGDSFVSVYAPVFNQSISSYVIPEK
jgi:hypothetical protein